MTLISRKVSSHIHDCAIGMCSIRDHTLEMDQWKYSNTGINMGIPTQLNQLISWAYQCQHLNQKWRYLSGIGRIKEQIVSELVGCGEFVNQKTFAAGYYSRTARPGAEPDIFIWGATRGASFATRGAVNGLCRAFRKRPSKILGGHWGGQAKFLGGSGPLTPP